MNFERIGNLDYYPSCDFCRAREREEAVYWHTKENKRYAVCFHCQDVMLEALNQDKFYFLKQSILKLYSFLLFKEHHKVFQFLMRSGVPLTISLYERQPAYLAMWNRYRLLFSAQDSAYRNTFHRVAVENEDCFDKWSKAPVSLPYPQDEKQEAFLLETIQFIYTEEGHKQSNSFELHIQEYPETD